MRDPYVKLWPALVMTVALTGGLAYPAFADQSGDVQDTPTTELDDVEVQGRLRAQEVRRKVDTFIESNMTPPAGRPLARWSKPICVATAQFSATYAQAVIDRVAQRIIEVGGDVAEPGCKADIMVIGTDDGAAMARSLVKDDPRGYRPARGSTDRGSRSLREFQEGDSPVRWWHVSMPVSVDTGEIAIRLDGEDYPTIPVRAASRLRTNVRDDLKRIVVIVDFDKMPANVRMSALVDYVAFLALAQVNPDGEATGVETILNLFHEPENLIGLTQWDLDYLSALYRVEGNRPGSSALNREIGNEVVRDRRRQ